MSHCVRRGQGELCEVGFCLLPLHGIWQASLHLRKHVIPPELSPQTEVLFKGCPRPHFLILNTSALCPT